MAEKTMSGLAFRLQRAAFGLSARHAAACLGVTKKTVYNWDERAFVPREAAEYVRREHARLRACLALFSRLSAAFGPRVPVCVDQASLHAFFPEARDISYETYSCAAGMALGRGGRDAAGVSLEGYREWLATGGAEDTLEALAGYLSEEAGGKGPKAPGDPARTTRGQEVPDAEPGQGPRP
jgi:hypothetical protein